MGKGNYEKSIEFHLLGDGGHRTAMDNDNSSNLWGLSVLMNIYEKMAAIRDEAGVIAKNLEISTGGTNKYKAVSERDVLDAIRPLMQKYRVYAYPIDRQCDEKDRVTTTSKYGDKMNFYFHYRNVMRFVNLDQTDEFIDVVSYSTGIDSGDKADGKAMTYADKYAFMKAFMLSTGDDPDQEASKEYATISNDLWKSLNRFYSKEEIKQMYAELGITNGKDIPMDYAVKKIEEYWAKSKKELPDKEFY